MALAATRTRMANTDCLKRRSSQEHEEWRVRCKKRDYSRALHGVARVRSAIASRPNRSGHDAKLFFILYSQIAWLADFLARLKQSPVLCDGATGTLLYAKGIFINRCYDELNVSQPDLIRDLHHEYMQAGAEIIETNTFGGNSFRLARHSMENRVRGD